MTLRWLARLPMRLLSRAAEAGDCVTGGIEDVFSAPVKA